jgi:hypothetical protein
MNKHIQPKEQVRGKGGVAAMTLLLVAAATVACAQEAIAETATQMTTTPFPLGKCSPPCT